MRLLSLLIAISFLGLTFTACDLTEWKGERKYDDDPKLEFKPLTEFVEEGDIEGGSETVTTNVQLIGEQRDSDLTVNYEVADSSTAVEGTHYQLGANSATISAGSSTAEVSIDVLDNSQDDGGEVYDLYLVLQESDGVEPAVNLKAFTLTFEGEDG